MIRLTSADYRVMPWANGQGTTTELVRVDGPTGLLWRLSMAQVVADGPFSRLPGVARNLTVIEGPGFDLAGDVALRCAPLVPVAFAGDLAVRACGVSAPSVDFNVMTAAALPRPQVAVLAGGQADCPAGGRLCLFALGSGRVRVDGQGADLARHDLVITGARAEFDGPMIVITIFG